MSAKEIKDLQELEQIIDKEESVEKEEEVKKVTPSEAKRLQLLQEDFIAKHKKVQVAECIFVYEKIDE